MEEKKMRLWHKDLIPYLPRKQLIAQWRECCAICSNIANKKTPNHILVNKIMDYPFENFLEYSRLVIYCLHERNYKISELSRMNFVKNFNKFSEYQDYTKETFGDWIFKDWHNDRYLKQCLFNLQEKYDCGGISDKEWKIIEDEFGHLL